MKKIILMILGSVTISLSALGTSNPTTLSIQKEEVWTSKAAINKNGAATVVWIKSHGQDLYSLQASTRAGCELPWDQAQVISEPMKISTFLPSMADNGTSTILWTANIDTQQYYYTQKKKSSPWLQAKTIDDRAKDVIIDFNGEPFVLPIAKQIDIFSKCKSYGQKKLPNKEQAYNPFFLKNSKGTIAALWGDLQQSLGYPRRGYKDYHFNSALYDAGTWSQITDHGRLGFTDIDKDKASDISAFLNNKDEIAVIWSQFESSQHQHRLKAFINREEADTIKKSQDGFTESTIWIDDVGNAVAVWIEPVKKQNVVYAAFKPQNHDWQGEQPLSNINHNAEHVQLSLGNGVFVVIWGESDSEAERLIFGATLVPAERKWSDPILLSPKGESCWYPSIAFGEKVGIITWTSHVKYSPHFQIQVANLNAP